MAKDDQSKKTASKPAVTHSATRDQPAGEINRTCGLIMPISAMGNYTAEHWSLVRGVLERAIEQANFRPELVSDGPASGIFHDSIVRNLHDNAVVVCDVSGRNANVMFELGMRLAFDKPTIIVKDEDTEFAADIAPIRHIEYTRSLRWDRINEFVEKLANCIDSTFKSSQEEGYTTFLAHFGRFRVSSLPEVSVNQADAIDVLLEEAIGTQERLTRIEQAIERSASIEQIKDAVARAVDLADMEDRQLVKEINEWMLKRATEFAQRVSPKCAITDDLIYEGGKHFSLRRHHMGASDRLFERLLREGACKAESAVRPQLEENSRTFYRQSAGGKS